MFKRITIERDEKGRFVKGFVPYNKGIKGKYHSGMFKKGHKGFISKEKYKEMGKNRIGTKHKEESKRKIGEKNAVHMKGKHNSPNTEFKKGPRHENWQGGKHVYWHKKARELMKTAGFNITNLEVHHINKDFTDNRIKNLQLLNKVEHTKLHWRQRQNE